MEDIKVIEFTFSDDSVIKCRASENDTLLISLGIMPDGMYWDLDVKKRIPSDYFNLTYTIKDYCAENDMLYANELDRFLSTYVKGMW